MSEPLPEIQGTAAPEDAAAAAPSSAGALLKAAREREGLHLAVLAATIKVTPAKLQALEQDRYDELPNATFTRALAQSVCRSLKIDPRPVLALLPQPDAPALEAAVGKLNAPFQERGGRAEGLGLTRVSKPMFWAGGLLLLAALVVGLVPSSLLDRVSAPGGEATPASGPAASALDAGAGETEDEGAHVGALAADAEGMAPAGEADAAVDAPVQAPLSLTPGAATVAASPAAPAAAASPVDVAASAAATAMTRAGTAAAPAGGRADAPLVAAAGLLIVRATAPSWVEVVDAQERVLISRVLEAGEAVQLDGRTPLRVRVGNAGATTLLLRGQPVDLAPHTRVNVARLELR
ncbi:MAG: hypothetical protein ABS84_04400 [Rubrivivax sp. SCN 71-131]|jgi:cytoskeleton protein RodZ|nr:MAG: hypothetical protein ABS84_04400 [Rubrivivax sp. SCN 71-131]